MRSGYIRRLDLDLMALSFCAVRKGVLMTHAQKGGYAVD